MADSLDSSNQMPCPAEAHELSEARYNAIIGGVIVWGFFLSCLVLRFAVPAFQFVINAEPEHYRAFMICFLIAYFALVIAGCRMLSFDSPGKRFAGYNLFVLLIWLVVALVTASTGYDPGLVIRAMLITAIITLSMMIVSMIFPVLFARMADGLNVALLAAIIVDIAATRIFRMNLTNTDFVVIGIMALYIGCQWVLAQTVRRTTANAILAASVLYLRFIFIFLRVLENLARNRKKR